VADGRFFGGPSPTLVRLELIPAQQIIAEVGVQASTFPSAAELTCWVGTCPGKDESAEENHSSRSAKGNNICTGC
jgi:transposase